MCGFCFAAELDDPCGDKGPGSLQSDSIQSDPGTIGFAIPDNTSSSEAITIGGTRDETLEVTGDKDWFRIDLTDGDAIQIDLFGLDHDSGNGLGELVDPYVRIRDASGNILAENDDIVLGVQRDSRLVFQASETDTYFIEVDSYLSSFAGDYRLQVAATTPPPPASPVDAIETNFTLNTNDPVLVYFAEAGDTYSYNGDTYTATGVNAYEQGQLFSVFEGVEQFIDVDFQITTDRNAADLEWATDTLPSSSGGTLLGFFFFPSSSGNGGFGVLNNNSSSFPSWNSSPGGTLDTGGFMYGVAVHELGHGLGLGHPHDGGGGSDVLQGVTSSSSRGNFGLNQAPFTAMSYNEGWNENPAGFASSVAATGHGATFGALDIAALQNMYGANTTHASGDDVYELFDTQATGSGAGYYATWDTGGTDEFRYTGTRDATIDLREATLQYENGGGGFMSYADGVIAGRTIANGVVIENATGGSGDDDLIGNDAANLLIGNAGDDTMTGGAGVDTFEFDFGDGFDTITDFEVGTDLIDFLGLGIAFSDLTITDNSGNAQITYDFTTSGEITLTGITAASLSTGDFLLDVGAGPITGTENADTLDGTTGDDEIFGLGGNDTITALAGNDSIDAGAGDDTIVYTSGEDTIDGGAGNDWLDLRGVTGDANFSLLTNLAIDGTSVDVQNVENILLSDVGNAIQDNNADNTIIGGAGNDTFSVLNGDDSLDGGDGVDALFLNDGGVSANPNYVIDLAAGTAAGSNGDVKQFANFETVAGGFGSNTFLGTSGADAVQGYDGDDLFTLEDGDDTAISGSGASTLSGGDGEDSLSAGAGNDTLDGGIGNDTLEGGADADLFTFALGDGEDIITDFEVGTDLIDLAGQGIVFSDLSILDVAGVATVTYDSVTTGVVTLTGVMAAELTQANFLTDPEAPPPLPQVIGTSGSDNVNGTSADEELLGLAGSDTLNGRGGEDVHAGGSGDDRYYLDSAGDTVVEQAGEGYDRVYSSMSFTLSDNVEAGSTRGANAMDITGNALANWITGNDETNILRGGGGADRLIGRGGSDTLNGDAGNDVLSGGSGADFFAFDAGTGTDLIQDFEVGLDVIDVTSLGIAYADLTIVDSGSRAVVIWDDPGDVGTRGILVVENTSASDLLLSSFVTVFGNDQPAIIGTSGNDNLTGSQIGDELQGLGGNDRLNGAGGADTMIGGTGDDRYDVEDVADVTIELAGEGTDQVYASVGYTLSDNVENLTATGSDGISLTGNAGVNWLTGNSGANALSAGAGNDRLIGREGADTLEGGTGNDIMEGGADADIFVFNAGDGTDTIQDFEDGTDLIDLSSLGETFTDIRIIDSGTNALVFYNEDDLPNRGIIVVNNQSAATLSETDFIFV